MTKKILLLLVSCLMVLSLIIASCDSESESGGTVTVEGEGQSVSVGGGDDEGDVGETGPTADVKADPDKPKYGGTL